MMTYLIIPAVLWLASYQLLTRTKGQKGFDLFFWHFILLGLEAVATLLLLDYFQVSYCNRITLAIIGIHTILFFGYCLKALLTGMLRSKTIPSMVNTQQPVAESAISSSTPSN